MNALIANYTPASKTQAEFVATDSSGNVLGLVRETVILEFAPAIDLGALGTVPNRLGRTPAIGFMIG